jgi:hypothetical protein
LFCRLLCWLLSFYIRLLVFKNFHSRNQKLFLICNMKYLEIYITMFMSIKDSNIFKIRRVWRYQIGNQNPYIEEEQATQWPSEKVQKDKQRSTKHIYKTKDRVTRTSLKTGDELMCSGRVRRSCSTSDTRRVNLVTKPVISHERGKDREVFTTSGTYPWSFVTQMFHSGQPSHGDDRKTFHVMTST